MKKIYLFLLALVCSVSMFGLEVTYDFTTGYPSDFPTSTGTTATTEKNVTINGNTIGVHTANSGNYYRANYSGTYSLFIGKNVKYNATSANTIASTAYIKVPGKAGYKITKVVAKNSANAATKSTNLAICNASYKLVADEVASTTSGTREMTFNVYTAEGSETLAENDAVYFCVSPNTANGKNMNIEKLVVTYTPVVTLSTAQYATYYNASDAFTMPAGLEGIVVDAIDGNSLDLTAYYSANDVVPAGEPLILHATTELSEATTFTLNIATTSGASLKSTGENLLSGTSTADEMTTGGDKYYRLSQHDGQVGFYYGATDGAAFKPGANKAYLAVSGASAPAHFLFEDEEQTATSIENIETEQAAKFIENGQLIIIKNGVRYNALGQVVR